MNSPCPTAAHWVRTLEGVAVLEGKFCALQGLLMSQEQAGEEEVGPCPAAHNFSPRNVQELVGKFKTWFAGKLEQTRCSSLVIW